MNSLSSGSAAWAEVLDCRIAGSLVRIEALPAAMRARLSDLFRPFILEDDLKLDVQHFDSPVARFRVIRQGRGDWIARQVDANGDAVGGEDRRSQIGGRIGHLLAMLEWRAMDAALGATSGVAIIHAAALRRGANTVFLLGKSGVGKTTLTLGLMGRGWQQFSDDVALVDKQSLEVRAFPRCFHVSAATLAALPVRPPLENVAGLGGYLRPLRWADGVGSPTAIVAVGRNPKQPAAMVRVPQAEAAATLLQSMMRNQLVGSDRARVAVRLASAARVCCEINNVSLVGALDMIEGAVNQ